MTDSQQGQPIPGILRNERRHSYQNDVYLQTAVAVLRGDAVPSNNSQPPSRDMVVVEYFGGHVLMTFQAVELSCDWEVPAEMIQIVISHKGCHKLRYGNTLYRLHAGEVLLLHSGSYNALLADDEGSFSILVVPLAELRGTAIAGSWLNNELRRELSVSQAPELEQWIQVMTQPLRPIDFFREHIRFHQLQVCHGLILQLYHGLGCEMITTLPLSDTVVAQLRREVLTRLHEDADIPALAVACKVSVKTLYNRLRSSLDCTPGELIRLLKIEGVFRELSNRPRTARNVTEVVIHYGFSNLGRFAQHYRQHIGELPSETLRR
ncbi:MULTISPECIES: helix-turn-helix domain-containing protein [unclassified Oceanobacter]|uniref:AraC family transcriptional regulator n=1 Tax=unclassified Oceanobacter TaxID=2620260 RepID=UPI002735AFA8|nr:MULTISPECIES: helix-turn-helix domain-containing protein [unclassified Oceanobacter]MDP2609064.1 helix-turn-helix domain-containing protein [Oceanobacter sp. 1_MG-2023]MDP2612386.1 helix-turn-helix domain-containing protein [Oceanobacter sp. 2_MG-2023]